MTEKLLSVPFVKQKPSYCGPATLAMVLQYHGHNISQDYLAERISCVEFFGSTISELKDCAVNEGFKAFSNESDLNELVSFINKGCPVIVAQYRSLTDKSIHYRVVVGYDSDREQVIYHDSEISNGDYLRVPQWLFLRVWHANEFSNPAVIVLP